MKEYLPSSGSEGLFYLCSAYLISDYQTYFPKHFLVTFRRSQLKILLITITTSMNNSTVLMSVILALWHSATVVWNYINGHFSVRSVPILKHLSSLLQGCKFYPSCLHVRSSHYRWSILLFFHISSSPRVTSTICHCLNQFGGNWPQIQLVRCWEGISTHTNIYCSILTLVWHWSSFNSTLKKRSPLSQNPSTEADEWILRSVLKYCFLPPNTKPPTD